MLLVYTGSARGLISQKYCADEPQKQRNNCAQLHLNFRFGLYYATIALLFLRSCQPLLLITNSRIDSCTDNSNLIL